VALILAEFGGEENELPDVNERPQPAHPPSFMTERAVPGHSPVINQHGKCWIDGIAFMLKGRRLRTGEDKIDRMQIHAR
jgi:hypothetical protein